MTDLLLSRILEPRLTTLCQDTETIGRLAAQKLIDLIENQSEEGLAAALYKNSSLFLCCAGNG